MSDNTTNFPPQTYSSSFVLNALVEGDSKLTCVNSDLSGDEEEKKTTGLDCFISTMRFYRIIVILSCLINFTVQAQQHPDVLVCMLDNRTRTFDSLAHYQGTNISFDPKHQGYLGNNVNFSFVSIDRLWKNSFISFGSNSIMRISLAHKQIIEIDDGAFLELFCLEELDLSGNALTELSRGVFKELSNLVRLNLAGNRLKDIPNMRDLGHLMHLDLSRNLIENLPSSVLPMPLISLNLGFNMIRFIKTDSFSNLSFLKILELNDNKLDMVDLESWQNLYALEELNLARNSLRSFNASHYLIHLKKLNLSVNHLVTLQAWSIKKCVALELLDITQNDWYCEDLEMIRHYLKGSKIVLQEPIICSEVKTTTSLPVVSTTNKESDQITDILLQNGEIMASNKKLEEHVVYLENMLELLVTITIIYIIVNISMNIGLCRNLHRRYLDRHIGYLDNSESETGILMTR